jgi:hypothetical protein
MIKSAMLAENATIQAIPCRAGMPVEFSEYGGELQHCTLTKRTDVPVEIDEGQSGKTTKDVACAKDRDVWLRTFERRLLERLGFRPRKLGSHWTLRWREVDSNHRSRVRKSGR